VPAAPVVSVSRDPGREVLAGTVLAQPFEKGAGQATVEDHHREQHQAVGEEDRGRIGPHRAQPVVRLIAISEPARAERPAEITNTIASETPRRAPAAAAT